jgi:2-polyprenyl-3-methyl-5-hydroxy-6-metoxy-1,4-benzoquinol methylase
MGESMENALRYHIEVDLSQENTSHAQLIRLTGRNKQVLEVGPATGYVTKVLQQRGCHVWCIENDAEAAKVAAEFCERMVVANVEAVDFKSTFPEERFDVVTFGDVLEHLVDPMGVLTRVKDILKPGGHVVASVPNVAHASIRLSLLRGQFQYAEMGLLDRTHLRFFTRESLADLFHGAGYKVRDWQRVLTDPFATEMELQEEDYPSYLREAARSDIEAMTYQFVVSAYPARSTGNGRTLPSSTSSPERNLLSELNGAIDSLHGQIDTALAERDSAVAQRDSALAQRDSTLAHLDEVVAQKDEAIAGLLGELGSIQGSTGYRMLAKYHGAARRLFPAGSRRGRPYSLLSSLARRVVADRRRGGKDNGNQREPESKHEGTEDKR